MKRSLISLLIMVSVFITYANDYYFPISVTITGGIENQDFTATESLIRRALNAENLTATEGALFEIEISPEEVTTETISGIRPTIATVYDLNMSISNVITNEQFATASIRIQGGGKDAVVARKAAARSLKSDNRELVGFIKRARSNVITYYEDNLDVIINQVRHALEFRQLDKCMWYLSSIPSCINRYDEVINLSSVVFDKYLTLECQEKFEKAKMAWAASPDQEGAKLAFSYLAGFDPESSCNDGVQELVSEIKEHIGKLYSDDTDRANMLLDLEIELRRADVDNEKARIEAMRAIGVAYGKNQQEQHMLINNLTK